MLETIRFFNNPSSTIWNTNFIIKEPIFKFFFIKCNVIFNYLILERIYPLEVSPKIWHCCLEHLTSYFLSFMIYCHKLLVTFIGLVCSKLHYWTRFLFKKNWFCSQRISRSINLISNWGCGYRIAAIVYLIA